MSIGVKRANFKKKSDPAPEWVNWCQNTNQDPMDRVMYGNCVTIKDEFNGTIRVVPVRQKPYRQAGMKRITPTIVDSEEINMEL